jgi:hypothetical protein
MKTLVYDAAKKLNVEPPRIFGLAYEWAERRVRRMVIVRVYRRWKYKQLTKQVVEDYCLDVLAGRTILNESEDDSDDLVL